MILKIKVLGSLRVLKSSTRVNEPWNYKASQAHWKRKYIWYLSPKSFFEGRFVERTSYGARRRTFGKDQSVKAMLMNIHSNPYVDSFCIRRFVIPRICFNKPAKTENSPWNWFKNTNIEFTPQMQEKSLVKFACVCKSTTYRHHSLRHYSRSQYSQSHSQNERIAPAPA